MSEPLADAEAFLALTDKIARDRGFGTASYKGTCLRRRIAVRMRARGTEDYAAYSHVLDDDPAEYDQLIDALTINVTKLFRNAETWLYLREQLLPALWDSPAPELHCWVAGCSSGEEAYTLAVLWHDLLTARGELHRRSRVRIVATDIDRASLEAARVGRYAESAFAEMPAALRERYFDATGSAVPAVREWLTFTRHDLLQEAPPAAPLHLVTCRNVVIYFDRDAQTALLQRVHDALAPGGVLVLGKVETLLGPSRTLFDVVDQRQRVFRRR
ncbi:MAG: protein-glutamate O-methyltransferase CheR [Gemmatimonadetes bacterium]|nr:protein-glutamate O-methyltransferase CheR [Gemmatimonadota bacterium]